MRLAPELGTIARIRLRFLFVALLAAALLAPAGAGAVAQPASGPQATASAKKACKRKQGESKKRWLKRCKCKAFKKGETRKKFKKRCPGAKVPKRKAPGGTQPPSTVARAARRARAGPERRRTRSRLR